MLADILPVAVPAALGLLGFLFASAMDYWVNGRLNRV